MIVQQEKISRAERSWTNALNALQEAIHFSFIKFCIYCSCGTNYLRTTPWESKKIINMVLVRDLWNFSFFGRGDVSPTHTELCRFVSGSQAKHQVSSPVIILLTKFLSASAITIMSWQDVTRPSLCSCDKKSGTKRAHNFFFPKSSFRMRITAVLGMFKDSAIVLYAIWRSFLTKSATAAMCTSVRVDFGRSPRSSSSTSSLPSRNREYRLITFDRFRASFP